MRKRHHPRIAIEGQYLDDIRIRCAEPYVYPVSYLSFSAHRHWARVEAQLAIDLRRFLGFLPRFLDDIPAQQTVRIAAVFGRRTIQRSTGF